MDGIISFRDTIRSYLNCIDQSYSVFSVIELYEYDIEGAQYYNKTLSQWQLCQANAQCDVYTLHTDYNQQNAN